MKSNFLFVALAIFFASVNSSPATEKDDIVKTVLNAAISCNEAGIPVERIVSIIEHRVAPENQDESCVASCTFEKTGLAKDKKTNLKMIEEINMVKYASHPEIVPKFMAIARPCAEEADKIMDDCDSAKSILTCLHEGVVKENIPFASISISK